MARRLPRKSKREPGSIDKLPSGALRVRVYAGTDPISHKPHYLTEVIPAETPKAAAEAEKTRTRFLNEINERRNPRTNATVSQLLKRYLDQFDGAPNTINRHHGDVKKHIGPFLGHIKVGVLDADILTGLHPSPTRHAVGTSRERLRSERNSDTLCPVHEPPVAVGDPLTGLCPAGAHDDVTA